MEWHKLMQHAEALPAAYFPEAKEKLFSVLDLTSLNADDTEEKMQTLLAQGITADSHAAAFCVFSKFIPFLSRHKPHADIKLATVANFPHGLCTQKEVLTEIETAIERGAQEIDLVFPYSAYINNQKKQALEIICAARLHANQCTLKIILETGELVSQDLIYEISRSVLDLGVDFIKSSTGKTQIGATYSACIAMLQALRDSAAAAGIKLSGGIRTNEQALRFMQITALWMGENWLTPNHFRLGVSRIPIPSITD